MQIQATDIQVENYLSRIVCQWLLAAIQCPIVIARYLPLTRSEARSANAPVSVEVDIELAPGSGARNGALPRQRSPFRQQDWLVFWLCLLGARRGC